MLITGAEQGIKLAPPVSVTDCRLPAISAATDVSDFRH